LADRTGVCAETPFIDPARTSVVEIRQPFLSMANGPCRTLRQPSVLLYFIETIQWNDHIGVFQQFQ